MSVYTLLSLIYLLGFGDPQLPAQVKQTPEQRLKDLLAGHKPRPGRQRTAGNDD